MPHERDEKTGEVGHFDDPRIKQAKRDLDAGQVDTDMRATPGLDAAQRERLVPSPTTPDKPANADPRTPSPTASPTPSTTASTPGRRPANPGRS
jgi:hypothetical protein